MSGVPPKSSLSPLPSPESLFQRQREARRQEKNAKKRFKLGQTNTHGETKKEERNRMKESEKTQAERQSRRQSKQGRESKLEMAGGVQAASQLRKGACQPGGEGLARNRAPARGSGSWAGHLAASAEPRPCA